MDRQRLSSIAHTHHRVAAPLADASIDDLIERTAPRPAMQILDLGCGEAAWLLRALELHPDATAVGVDTSSWSIRRAREAADGLGLGDRLILHESDATQFPAASAFDLVLCVGSTHVFGGLESTLPAAAMHLRPGGRLLVGDGFWETPPDRPTLDALGMHASELLDLPDTVDLVERSGWSVTYACVSTRHEWDDYEWSWCGSLAEWALEHPSDPDAGEALATSHEHRDGWLRGYRGVLGFVCLVLIGGRGEG